MANLLGPPENGETVAASRLLWGLPQNHRSWRIFIWNCLVATSRRKLKETKSSKRNKFRKWEMKRTQIPKTTNHVSQKQAWEKNANLQEWRELQCLRNRGLLLTPAHLYRCTPHTLWRPLQAHTMRPVPTGREWHGHHHPYRRHMENLDKQTVFL